MILLLSVSVRFFVQTRLSIIITTFISLTSATSSVSPSAAVTTATIPVNSFSGKKQLLQSIDAEKNLALKDDVPVILTRNLPGKLYNGMIGKVVTAKKDKAPVINFNGRIVSLDRVRFEIYDPEQEKVLAVRCQFPIRLAFALTVHRAQGQTKDKIEIDCFSFFAAGQLGVALGRATSSRGIRVLNYNPTAARIQHPKSVYDFNLYAGVPFRLDLACCKNKYPTDNQDHPHNQGDFPTQGGDADRLSINEGRVHYHHQETLTVEPIPGSTNCPLTVESFLSDHGNASFLPSDPVSKEFKGHLKKHMGFLTKNIEIIMQKQPTGNEDFVLLYKKLNDFLTSETHYSVCASLSDSPKPQKLSSKAAYWILKQEIKQISESFTKKQAEKEGGNVVLQNEPTSSAKSKIRYVAGACLHKITTRLQGVVSGNLGRLHKKSQVQRAWSYRMHRLLKTLRISEEQVVKETQVPDSISEIEFRQGPSRGLLHVGDDVFQFFVKLHNFTQKLVNHEAFHLAGENIHLVARGQIFTNLELSSAWMDLFADTEHNNDDETFNSMVVELYELVAEHFLRISIIEGLHSFKTAIPRKKKQALRSKVTALSERKETGANRTQAEKTVSENLFLCPICKEECKEEPDQYNENSIGCDCCNNWYHFKCVALTGAEMFLHDERSAWKCSGCLQRGKGKGKKSTR